MHRRTFVRSLAAVPLAGAFARQPALPALRVVTPFTRTGTFGMPGPYPGTVVSVRSDSCVDESSNAANDAVVREMMARGMCALTGESTAAAAWRRFFTPADIVGIKVNCGGFPFVVSSYEVVAETIRQLMAVGIPASQIHIYERFQSQLTEVDYAPRVPAGVQIDAAERANRRTDMAGYDPAVYVEADLFGEDDTRSSLMRLVSGRLTKIINIPNMKDHGATGVTGCLKNVAYGSFSNVSRTHDNGRSHTYSFVGTLASVEPLRTRTVLQIMDGLRGVWHGGPFARTKQYVFYPKTMMFGTDPVAIDRLLLDVIDSKRKAEGAISIWDRSEKYLKVMNTQARDADPNVNIIIREPGHVKFAASLGLGVEERSKITVREIRV